MMKNLLIVLVIVVIIIASGFWFWWQSEEAQAPINGGLSLSEALAIAQNTSECSMTGILGQNYIYNEVTKTWWFDLERMPELETDGCNPACVVSEETNTAEVNWRCTGLIPPE